MKDIKNICFRGAIFDLDGTILDSMPCWESVGMRYLDKQKVVVDDKNGLNRRLKTMTLAESARLFQREFGISESAETICDDILAMISDDYRYHAPLKPNTRQMLEHLAENGVCMGIATATDCQLAQAALERLEVWEYFQFLFTCQQLNTTKQEPFMFDCAVKELGVPKQDVVVFEDALYSMQTAAKAGYRVIGVFDASSQDDVGEIQNVCEDFLMDWAQLRVIASNSHI